MIDKRDNMGRLALLFQDRVHELTQTSPIIEFGSIDEDLSVVCDSLGIPIPKGEYITCESVSRLEEGNRVVVGWVGTGTNPDVVILGKI